MNARTRKQLLVHLLLGLSVLTLVLPVVWLVVMSFRPIPVLFTGMGTITSREFTLNNYLELLRNYNVPLYTFNSFLAAFVPTLIAILGGFLGAYSMARFRVTGSGLLYSLPLFAQIVPAIQIVLPLYLIMLAFALLNTHIALIIAYTALILPFMVWMLSGYLAGVPVELEEAAMIDGCSRLGAIFRIVLPVSFPGIIATGIVGFLNIWGDFLFAFTLVQGESLRLMGVAVYLFLPGAQTPTAWGNLFAISTLYMLPSIVLFFILQPLIAKGISAGAVQG